MPRWVIAFCLLGLACSSSQTTPDVSLDHVAPEASATASSATSPGPSAAVVQKVRYWSASPDLGRDFKEIASRMTACVEAARAQAAEGAPVDDQLAKAIAMDSCREMLRGIADADVNLFTPKERQLLDRAATGRDDLRTQAETIQERRRTEWSSWCANAANEVVREVAPIYRAVDLGDSGPPRWRTFARKRLFELARELGSAAIEEILPGTRADDLRSAKYVEAATTGWP